MAPESIKIDIRSDRNASFFSVEIGASASAKSICNNSFWTAGELGEPTVRSNLTKSSAWLSFQRLLGKPVTVGGNKPTELRSTPSNLVTSISGRSVPVTTVGSRTLVVLNLLSAICLYSKNFDDEVAENIAVAATNVMMKQ